MKPGQAFCRICGIGLQGAGAGRPAPRPAQRSTPQPAAPPTPIPPSAAAPPRKGRSRLLQGILGVVVPVASLVLTYYITNKALGTVLAQQFGDVARQVVPLIVSMVVGGIARQIMTGRS